MPEPMIVKMKKENEVNINGYLKPGEFTSDSLTNMLDAVIRHHLEKDEKKNPERVAIVKLTDESIGDDDHLEGCDCDKK